MAEDIRDTIASLAERRIRDAIDAGELDDVAGEGRPLPGVGTPDDEMWWIRNWLARQRESVTDESPGV